MSLKAALSFRAFLISSAVTYGILAVFQETRALVFTNEFDERWHVGLPVFRKSFKVLKSRVHT